MVNNAQFAGRIKKILSYYDITAAQMADKIGVQRSSISHLLSGRNKPSLDFVVKVIKSYNNVDLYWLLNGTGTFPKVTDAHKPSETPKPSESLSEKHIAKKKIEVNKDIEHIIIFYKDGSFKKYEAI